MGFTNNTTWSHSAEKTSNFGTYRNDTSKTVYIYSITAYLGTGKGTFKHYPSGSTRAYGNAIDASLRIDNTTFSQVTTIVNVVNATSQGYTNVDQCASTTFYFSPALQVASGKTCDIDITWSGGTILCYAKNTPMTGDVKSNFTVSYNSNGGSGSMDSHSVTPGSSVKLKNNDFTAPKDTTNSCTITRNGNGGVSLAPLTCRTKTSYTFRQWRAGSTAGTAYAQGASFTPSNDTVMYADWRGSTTGGVILGSTTRGSVSSKGYTITFDGNGGTATKTSQQQSNTRAYIFKGWNIDPSATSANLSDTAICTFHSDTTVYAIWGSVILNGSVEATAAKSNSTSTRTVTFSPNGGTCSTTSLSSTSTTTYGFNGWYTAASGGTARSDSTGSFTPTRTEKVYAQWTASSSGYTAVTLPTPTKTSASVTYTVTFNGNGGSLTSSSATSTKTTSYNCSGWYTAASGGTKRGGAGGSYTPTTSETLYAHWTSSTGTPTSVTLPTGSRSGYTLLGFADSSSATSAQYAPGTQYTPSGNTTLYAIWSASRYTLTINPKGGTWGGSTGTSTIAGNTNGTTTIAAPTRPGYIFAGWYKTAYGSLSGSSAQNPLMTSSSNLPLAVYNNNGNGVVTHERQADTTAGYTYTTKITTSSNAASPGLGGFYTSTNSAGGATFIHVFRAKIPKGYYLQQHNNPVGDNSKFTWLTSTEGTGNWQDYAYKLVCGTSGTFSSFGHVALYHSSGATPVTWYVGGTQVTKNPTSAQTFTFGAGDTTLYAQWIPEGLVHIWNGNEWKKAFAFVWNGNEWKMTIPYVWNGNDWKMSGG